MTPSTQKYGVLQNPVAFEFLESGLPFFSSQLPELSFLHESCLSDVLRFNIGILRYPEILKREPLFVADLKCIV